MIWHTPRGPRGFVLRELARLEPVVSRLLNEDGLVHVCAPASPVGRRRHRCRIAKATAASAARLILNHRAYLAGEFDLAPSRALFKPKHALEVRRLLAPANDDEANRIISELMDNLGHELLLSAIHEAKALLSALEADLPRPGRCSCEHRAADRLMFVVLGAFARAWDEAWALDVFGSINL